MKLVKDLNEQGVVLYWIDNGSDKLSPDLPTIIAAEEWWKEYKFDMYEGEERRKSIYDRRKDTEMRKHFEFNQKYERLRPYGRRETDVPVSVEIDLFQEKLRNFYSA